MMKKTPDHLVKRFLKLADDFEAFYRQDERERVFADLRDALSISREDLFGSPTVEPQPQPVQTDMHGMMLNGEPENSEPVKNSRRIPAEYWKTYQRPLSRKHHKMITVLNGRRFFTVSEIADRVGLKSTTVQQYLYDLQDHGHDIQTRKVSYRYGRNGKRGHRKMYRLAASQ